MRYSFVKDHQISVSSGINISLILLMILIL